MQNPITESPAKLIPQITMVLPGVTRHGAALGFAADLATSIAAKKAALVLSDSHYEQAKRDLMSATAARRLAIRKSRNHMQAVRELVKPDLTPTYSQAWDAFGFTGSLRVPTNVSSLLSALTKMGSHLAAHPDLGAEESRLVAAKTQAMEAALMAANTTVNEKKAILQRSFEARAGKAAAARLVLREVFSSLRLKLSPLDARWVEFGFNKPGAQPIPEVPTNVTAVSLSATATSVKWPPVPRAQHYRLWKRVIGVDAEMVFVGSTAGLDYLIEQSPDNSQVEYALSAVNNGGESGRSTVVLVQREGSIGTVLEH